MASNDILLTKDGLSALQKELDELKNVKLREVISRLAKAREDGDLSENSAYQFGKQEQEFIEGRIEELEEILRGAKLVAINNQKGKKSTIDFGCKVTLSFKGKKQVFQIVGEWEAKPTERKISGSSPLGKALIGKKVGDKVEVDAPVGKLIYAIVAIE